LAFFGEGDVLCFSLPPPYSKSYSLDDFTATLDIGIMESADINLQLENVKKNYKVAFCITGQETVQTLEA
jgi:hypothetical protein